MRGLGLASLAVLLLLSAALPLCSAVPDTVEWPRPSVGTPPKMNAMTISVFEMSDVGAAAKSGSVSLVVLDANGTAVANATVFAFSSEEAEFDAARALTGDDGLATFNFTLLVEPYAGMSVVASAMKPGYENADVLVYLAGETAEAPEPASKDAAEPSDPLGGVVTAAALVAGGVSLALYVYWSRGA